MGIQQVKVREIINQAVNKSLDIPEFQREFVWDPEQVKKLAESLYRLYPVGSFLLWESAKYQEAQTAQGTQATRWIVDGQQRTTALCLLLDLKPFWWPDTQSWNKARDRYAVMVNLLPDGDGEQLDFALPNPVRRRDPRWVEVRRVLSTAKVEDLTPLATDIVRQITPDLAQQMQIFGKVHGRLQRLWQIRETDIPLVEVSHEVEDVAEIFARLNQEGTRVREADVVLALAAARNPGWVREDYLPFRNDLEDRGWSLDSGIFIRAMTSIGHGRARLIEVPKTFWNPESVPAAWKVTRETIAEVVRRLAEFGILSPDLLPSTNSLIPLIVLHQRWGQRPDYRFEQALHWFLLANRDGRYSGSAITSLNEDVRAVRDSTTFAEALKALATQLKVETEVKGEEFLARYDRAGNRFLRLMVYLVLFHAGARDWVDKTRIAYDKTGASAIAGFEPQWHHIFSRKILNQAEVETDTIHALANITVLNEKTNVKRLSAKEPWRYIRDFKIAAKDLSDHGAPSSFVAALASEEQLREQWAVARHGDFLLGRAEILAARANELLGGLRAGERKE